MKDDILLIIPDKFDVERHALALAWSEKYGDVLEVGKFWIKPETGGKKVALYGYDSFCLVLAQIMNLSMISPQDDIIAELEMPYVKRRIVVKALLDIPDISYPIFVKPVTPKIFKAQVYTSPMELQDATQGIVLEEKILISDIIEVNKEVRVWVLNRQIQDLAFYEGDGNIENAFTFAQDFLTKTKASLPKTFVMDLGYNDLKGWFIIEFNSSWGAGLNFCNPIKVIDCIKEATLMEL